jgi:hypothetical protein
MLTSGWKRWKPIGGVAPVQSSRGADASIAVSYCKLSCNIMRLV